MKRMVNWVVWNSMPSEPERSAWCEWLRWHGIDPADVAIPGWVERDEAARRIRYESFVWNERGVPQLNAERTGTRREVRTVQLEAVPSNFPYPPTPDRSAR